MELRRFIIIDCIRYVKDTILKAIYNEDSTRLQNATTVFDMSKIQFWKQFTTAHLFAFGNTQLYSICQRYNFESNLQLSICLSKSDKYCIRYVKDTILKAIYNGCRVDFRKKELYSICQRYNFESNLQLTQ